MEGAPLQQTPPPVFWRNPACRRPLLFSLGVHLFILGILFFPTSLFHLPQHAPEIYSVALIDLSEPLQEPETQNPPSPPPMVKPPTVAEPAVSTQPVLSTRNIPQAPTEIKFLRPRAVKKDVRKDQPPIDQTMVMASLQRMQNQEKAQQAQRELDQANEAAEQANEEVLQALRHSILARPSQGINTSQISGGSTSRTGDANATGSQTGQAADTASKQYKATVNHHIGQYWYLPEGQKWDSTLKATVIVRLKPDGIVTSTEIEVSSKSKQFDKIVIETVERASPLPPIPAELENISLKLHFSPEGLQ
ncbi:MAG: TonB family protein [Desulfobulbaceae bacterium]|jgi:protein TonB|nr:TonB family protein [Desulfobulbaceae bacterium]